ncbi:hypothetical protein [Pseudomonas sp. R3-18-08]|uniref:hypothetical protein n=1 Tax=Pseudomonas sp. R3-18-08 TaxID=1173283 RepID=UPI000F568120|nr:hypothetical protein [Pseudomonas sp. R3-18-08]AZF18610.1 hypothetical protein C4J92_5173 [Pseudomonas sp. R3-18-08]
MPIRVDLLALEPNVPGQARLAVKKWNGAQEQLEFSIQRNQDHFYLQDRQQWSNNPFWFKVSQFNAVDDALETLVGADVVNPLLEGGGNSNFQIELREQGLGHSDRGIVRPGLGLLSSTAGGQTRSTYDATMLNVPEVEPEISALPELVLQLPPDEPVPAPLVAERGPEPVPVTPPKRSNKVLIGVIIAVLIVLLAAVAAWLWLRDSTPVPAPAVQAPAPVAQALPCDAASMDSQPELAFVQACVKAAPASAQLLEIIEAAKSNKHCGVAQRLYANRAQGGDMLIAKAYAREYDPKYLKASECFPKPDNATAAYWYETILSHEADNTEAKQRLEELQP